MPTANTAGGHAHRAARRSAAPAPTAAPASPTTSDERQVEEQQRLQRCRAKKPARRAGVERSVVVERERQRSGSRGSRSAGSGRAGPTSGPSPAAITTGRVQDHGRGERRGAEAQRRRAAASPRADASEHDPDAAKSANSMPPGGARAGQHAGERRAGARRRAARRARRPSAIGNGCGPLGIRHRQHARRPRRRARAAGRRRAAREAAGEQRRRWRRRARARSARAAATGRTSARSAAEQVRLARRIEPPEVAVGHLAVRDPRGRLQHQPLVVGLDVVQHRRARDEQRRPAQERSRRGIRAGARAGVTARSRRA